MSRRLLPVLIICLMVSVIYISIQTPDLFKSNSPKMIGDYNFENVKISLLKKGKKQWELTAKKSTIFDNATKFYLVDVNGSYSNKDKNQSIHFSSPTGAYYIDSGVLKLVKTSSRLTYNDSSYFILSDEMELNSEEQMLYAHGNLNINSDKLILTGQKMIGNLNTNQIYLTYDIQGSIFTATD